MPHAPLKLALGAIILAAATPAFAVDDGPRAYFPVPVGTNNFNLIGITQKTNSSLDPATAIKGADATVDGGERLQVHLAEATVEVRHSSVRLPARLQHRLVWIRSDDELHHAESLAGAIGGEFAKLFERHPLREALPPRIAEPEERHAVGVGEPPAVGGDPRKPVQEKLIAAGRLRRCERSLAVMEAAVGGAGGLHAEPILPGHGWGEPHGPRVAPRPERGHPPGLRAGREGDIDRDAAEGIVVRLRRREALFERLPDGHRRLAGRQPHDTHDRDGHEQRVKQPWMVLHHSADHSRRPASTRSGDAASD
jgi:hypothetical protein